MRDGKGRRAKTAALVLAAVALLVLAAVSAVATPSDGHELGAVGSAASGRQAGTIGFSPAGVVAGSGAFNLTMTLSSPQAAVPTWTVGWSGPTGTAALSVVSSSTASVVANVATGLVTTPGSAYITVSDGTNSWLGTNFVISTPTPTLTSIVPTSTPAGSAAFTLTATGASFVGGAHVRWNGSALASTVNSATSISASVPAANVASVGTASITVDNGSGAPPSNALTFTITTPTTPTLTGINPMTGANASQSVSFTLTGTNLLLAGSSSTVTLRAASSAVATATVSARTATAIQGTFNLASPTVPPGAYNVVLTGNGHVATLPGGFTVTGPKLTSITPNYGVNANAAQGFTLVGTGLNGLTTPSVALKSPTFTVTATGLTAAPSGLGMTGYFNLASPVAPAGVYDVVLTYSGVASVKLAGAYAVNNPVPAITSLSPTTVYAGSTQPDLVLTVNGTGFVPAPAVAGGVGSRIQIGSRVATDTVFISATQVRTTLLPADIAVVATVPVRVVNPKPAGTTGGGASPPVNLTVAADTASPVTTISGADDLWHSTEVTLTVSAADAQSGVQKTGYIIGSDAPAWLTGSTITVPADGSREGANVVTAWSVDWCGNVESPGPSVTVNMDTTGPKTTAKVPSSVKRGKKISFRYRANDLTPKCDFTLKIRYKSTNKSARTYKMGFKSSNADHRYKINPHLAKGRYIYLVYAHDQAGNPQSKLGQKTFRVK